jgi:hypothetical protein
MQDEPSWKIIKQFSQIPDEFICQGGLVRTWWITKESAHPFRPVKKRRNVPFLFHFRTSSFTCQGKNICGGHWGEGAVDSRPLQ